MQRKAISGKETNYRGEKVRLNDKNDMIIRNNAPWVNDNLGVKELKELRS